MKNKNARDEIHVLMELDGNNGLQRTYLYGGNQQLGEEPVAADRAADRYLLQGGSVGNITHAVNRAGAIENEYGYDAFGMRTNVTTTGASTRYGYTGEHYDEETGLLYLRARYYDPMIGRFISVDPYLGRLEEPETQNRFVYVHNNPLIYKDANGLCVPACLVPIGQYLKSNFPGAVISAGGTYVASINSGSSAPDATLDAVIAGGSALIFGPLVAKATSSPVAQTIVTSSAGNVASQVFRSDDFSNQQLAIATISSVVPGGIVGVGSTSKYAFESLLVGELVQQSTGIYLSNELKYFDLGMAENCSACPCR